MSARHDWEWVVPTASDEPLTLILQADVEWDDFGAAKVVGLHITGAEPDGLTTTMLRYISLEPLRRQLYEQLRPEIGPTDNAPTPRTIVAVAGIHNAAVRAGYPPVVAVAEALDIGRARAANWITRARRDGLVTTEWRPKDRTPEGADDGPAE